MSIHPPNELRGFLANVSINSLQQNTARGVKMMRKIKFRGVRDNTKEWVYGYILRTFKSNPIPGDETTWINDGDRSYKVIPESVGQFTGLFDENKTEIYENDNVEVVTLGLNYSGDKVTGTVKCIDGCFTVVFSEPVYSGVLNCMLLSTYVKCFVVNHAIKVIDKGL